MRYWLDTEFIENGRTIDLISIGIVAEDGREFYAVNEDCDFGKASDWVRENVLDPMGIKVLENNNLYISPETGKAMMAKSSIPLFVQSFILPDLKPEFWGYYADYDWVVFCQLFGTMMDLPRHFPMYCRDIKQWCDDLGNPRLPEQGKGEHHALADAKWNKQAWEFLRTYSEDCVVERK